MWRSVSKSSGLDNYKRTKPPWAFATGSRFLARGNISSGIMTIIIIFCCGQIITSTCGSETLGALTLHRFFSVQVESCFHFLKCLVTEKNPFILSWRNVHDELRHPVIMSVVVLPYEVLNSV